MLAMVLCSTALPGASVASNHQVFNDVVGDDSGGLAPDIVSLDMTSADNGDVALRLTLNEPNGTFYIGDDVEILIDRDLNGSTGSNGFEAGLFAQGIRDSPTSGHVKYTLCTYNSSTDFHCEDFASGEVKNEKTGTNTHVVTYELSTAWHTVGLVVFGAYKNPDDPNAQQVFDRAPDSGAYQFDARADADNDGVAGYADECPRFPGGKFDRDAGGDFDGCPPFYPVPSFTFRGARFGSSVVFSRIAVSNAPGGATVTLRMGGRVVHRRGPGALPGVAGRAFRMGTTATFIYSSPDYFGRYKVARVSAAGLSVVRSGCTPPGRTTFIDCKKVKG